jgi:hypothetical protein
MTGLIVKLETVAEAALDTLKTDGEAALQTIEGVAKADATVIETDLEQAFFNALETLGGDLLKQLLPQLVPGATVTVPSPAPSAPAAATPSAAG